MPIFRAKDKDKDQTYFLWQIKKEQLEHILLPIGEFQNKASVREFANQNNLITSTKPDSQGLCFVGQTSLREMLLQTLGEKKGDIVTKMSPKEIQSIGLNSAKFFGKVEDVEKRKVVTIGQHQGAFLFTIGQRQNLGLSNGPWFVSNIDVKKNLVYVCHNNFVEELDCTQINVNDCNWQLDLQNDDGNNNQKWLKKDENEYILECLCQVRYRSKAIRCKVIFETNKMEDKDIFDTAKVIFEEPVRAVAIGQSAVFYSKEDQLLGGGFIHQIIV
jgi:tRNA-uridine 2-sulfurtransferase